MKKKNLIILLIFPFLIALFCTAAINTTYNLIDVDISSIEWSYNDMEPFHMSEELYELRASGVNQRNYAVSDGNDLVWTVENKDGSEELYAEIVEKNGKFYLKTVSPGIVTVTCSNLKGNVFRSMTGIVYENAAIMLYPTVSTSQSNIDPTIYYGEYDHSYGTTASIEMTLATVPSGLSSSVTAQTSDNISFDTGTGLISIHGVGDAFVTVSDSEGLADPITFSFTIVKDGVNVYTYEDLLNCTNRSQDGEIVVLRKHFESLENAYVLGSDGKPLISGGKPVLKSGNVECFGNYDVNTGSFSFLDEAYYCKTTYNTSFIEQWNEFASKNADYSAISDSIYVGLRVQKDFYGNGYTVNMHNLTYPYTNIPAVAEDGSTVRIPQLTEDNLFRGPLKLYSLGDPNNMPLVSLYGQDNAGMYLEGDGITLNDVNVKNCDFGDRMANLDTVGTVIEVYGDNITIVNTRASNGKNVVRSFSSQNLTVKNCLLSNARNFLFLTGSNEYVPVDSDALATFYTLDGEAQTVATEIFIARDGMGDEILNTFLTAYCTTSEEKDNMRRALISIQSALNSAADGGLEYMGSTVIDDTYFYRSGISSICMETLFNSAFLETASPSIVSEDIFGRLSSDGKSIVPYVATEVSGVSYPVSLVVTGATEFYDYKTSDGIDLDGLIEENISDIASSLQLYDGVIDINTIFPLRSILMQKATSAGYLYSDSESGNTYVNIPVAFYGGGLNLSTVSFTTDSAESVTSELEVDLLDTYLNLTGSSSSDLLSVMKGLILKTVTAVTGFEPFRFNFVRNGHLFGETPRIADLIQNAKGE